MLKGMDRDEAWAAAKEAYAYEGPEPGVRPGGRNAAGYSQVSAASSRSSTRSTPGASAPNPPAADEAATAADAAAPRELAPESL